jgi:hypothetical protein
MRIQPVEELSPTAARKLFKDGHNFQVYHRYNFKQDNLVLLLVLLSDATLVAADYGFTCPPGFMSVVLCVGTDANCNFSAVRSPIGLKLGGDLGLVSQISVHVLVSKI